MTPQVASAIIKFVENQMPQVIEKLDDINKSLGSIDSELANVKEAMRYLEVTITT